MKWKLSIFEMSVAAKLLLLLIVSHIFSSRVMAETVSQADSAAFMRYDEKLQRRENRWRKLLPDQYVLQYAGGTGMFSFGPGWSYGRNSQWETQLLLGFLPKRYNHPTYWMLTVKENFLPWTLGIRWFDNLYISPLCVSFGINSILHSDFWTSEPERYPKGYYGFSSRVRFRLGIGQRLTYDLPADKRYIARRISVYYEISTCDVYVRQKFLSSSIPFRDIIAIGVGLVCYI